LRRAAAVARGREGAQFLTFTTAPNLQAAVAYGLGKPPEYFFEHAQGTGAKQGPLNKGLESIVSVLKSQGTYFSPSIVAARLTRPTKPFASAS